MENRQDRALRFAYFLIGIALPLAGWALWSKVRYDGKRAQADNALDETVEDSFPASDPPASW